MFAAYWLAILVVSRPPRDLITLLLRPDLTLYTETTPEAMSIAMYTSEIYRSWACFYICRIQECIKDFICKLLALNACLSSNRVHRPL
jgi:hypothetical protein